MTACSCASVAVAGTGVVVVGGGPLGLLAARRLAAAGRQVVLVEQGVGAERTAGAGYVGSPQLDLGRALGQGLGGTAPWWGGQCVSLPAEDLAAEPARGATRWPWSVEELAPWTAAAFREAGLRVDDEHAARRRARRLLPERVSGTVLRPTVYMPRHRLDQTWAAEVRRTPGVRVLEGLRVTHVRPGRDGVTVRATCAAGHETEVKGEGVVLAAGALANADLLLRSPDLPRAPRLGTGLSEHLTVVVAEVRAADLRAVATALGTAYAGTRRYWPKLALSAHTRQDLGVPAVAADLLMDYRPDVAGARGALSARHDGARDLRALPRAARALTGAALARVRGSGVDAPAVDSVRLQLNVEQPARTENRVYVDDDGRSRVAWRVHEDDLRAVRVVTEHLATVWPRALGRLTPIDGLDDDAALLARIAPAYHHSGTTVSGDDGVVDRSLRLRGEPRILVLGPSTFPTPSWVNPTLTAWATALHALSDWEDSCLGGLARAAR